MLATVLVCACNENEFLLQNHLELIDSFTSLLAVQTFLMMSELLDLNQNKLSGTIPTQLEELDNLGKCCLIWQI